MLATFDSIESRSTYIGGHLMEATSHYENLTALCHLSDVQIRAQRQLVDLESRYVNLSMNRDFMYSNQWPLENSNILSIFVEKGRG